MQHSGDVLYWLCNVWSLSWEHSNGLRAGILWKLLYSHVWCLAGMTQTSWDSGQGHRHVDSLYGLGSVLAGF